MAGFEVISFVYQDYGRGVLASVNIERSIHVPVTIVIYAHTYPQLYQQNKKYVVY